MIADQQKEVRKRAMKGNYLQKCTFAINVCRQCRQRYRCRVSKKEEEAPKSYKIMHKIARSALACGSLAGFVRFVFNLKQSRDRWPQANGSFSPCFSALAVFLLVLLKRNEQRREKMSSLCCRRFFFISFSFFFLILLSHSLTRASCFLGR